MDVRSSTCSSVFLLSASLHPHGVAGRRHISAANRFASLPVTAWTDRSEGSYGKYGSDVAGKASKEGAETWRLSGTQG